MLKSLLLSFCTLVFFTACAQKPTTAGDGKHFGAPITAKKAIPYEKVMAKMEKVDSMSMKVTGRVKEVCLKKGCWMTLVSDKPGYPEMRVTFKDYAFFMPKDLSGKRVVIDGFARVETTSVEVLRHYAEDAKKSPEEIAAIKTPKREVAFEAAGVLILDK
ncbi:MAG: DUF4920 domain-containing protein [Saprospiraceae bacterium]|nr:DUF4920 domain-containing protein [Saprospiraceae bacterium]